MVGSAADSAAENRVGELRLSTMLLSISFITTNILGNEWRNPPTNITCNSLIDERTYLLLYTTHQAWPEAPTAATALTAAFAVAPETNSTSYYWTEKLKLYQHTPALLHPATQVYTHML